MIGSLPFSDTQTFNPAPRLTSDAVYDVFGSRILHPDTSSAVHFTERRFTERNEPVTFPIVTYDLPAGQRSSNTNRLEPSLGTHMGMQVGTGGAFSEDLRDLIACRTIGDAMTLIDLLGLDTDLWVAMGIGDPLIGYRFNRALVVGAGDGPIERAVEWLKVLRTKAEKVVLL